MPTVSSDIDIALPVRTVYDQWTQFEDYPAFMSGVEEVRQLDDRTLYWDVRVGGVERGFQAEITEQLPDERIAWRSTSGPPNAGVVTFHRLDERTTRVRLQLEWEPEGLVERVGSALQIDDAQVAADLREFARLMEDNGFATGAWRGTIGS
ncbi:SRPBCC family protein [Leucobacter allii]|uniref:SRPBCC family protein n=1 Tax=Leucobacter allii TaxID=2932247 RepID=A0ABY4FQ69_9MICO|nr:SRPBCC family protein [Leucobacter allii]UOQ58436.1 SRPBCC family protein [Leucobacter allii]UOR03016.1 SRPBCC family protein [Leucobacter allii]